MLGRRIKIMTILKQREFITRQLEDTVHTITGNPAYTYIGHIYPENCIHFYNEGWKISEVNSDTLIADTEGLPIWLFTPNDDIILTDEEMKNAEKYVDLNEEKLSQKEMPIHLIYNATLG